MQQWFEAMSQLELQWGVSFHLDFHTIPFHGEEALVEKHYVSKRSRSQKGILAFLAQDAERRVFCYANADIRKDEQNDEILRFVKFWQDRTGHRPEELIFDSKLGAAADRPEIEVEIVGRKASLGLISNWTNAAITKRDGQWETRVGLRPHRDDRHGPAHPCDLWFDQSR